MKKNTKIFRSIGVFLLAIAVPTLISGCSLRGSSTQTSSPKIITIWGFDDEDVWKPVIKDIQSDYESYEFNYVKKSLTSNYESDSLNSILSNQGPDVWAIPNDWVYRHKDKLVAMPDKLIKTISLDDDFVPAIKESGYFDEKLYSLSPLTDSLMLYYNPTLFTQALEEIENANQTSSRDSETIRAKKRATVKDASNTLSSPPVTWENFTAASRLITKKSGNTITRAGAAIGTGSNISKSADILYAMFLQNSTKMTSDDLKTALFNLPSESNSSDNPGKRALDFMASFSNPSSLNYTWNKSFSSDVKAFTDSKVAMIFGTSSLGNYFSQIFPNFKYKKAPLPQIGGNNENIIDYADYITFSVPALSKNQDIAWDLISRLSIDNSYPNAIGVPSSEKKKDFAPSYQDREGNTNPGRIQNQTAKMWNKGRYPEQVDSLIVSMINTVSAGKLNIQSAMDDTSNKISNYLRKETW